MKKYDVIIIGGGPGGATLGAYLTQQSLNVAIFEREIFPRFHIGESLLPSSMPIFREIGFYDKLNSGKYIQKFGARFVDYRSHDEIYFGFDDGLDPTVNMAFEVERSQFDQDLLAHAKSMGAAIHQPERVKAIEFTNSETLVTTNLGNYSAAFVVDASGRDSLIGKSRSARKPNLDLNNVAVFSHFTGVKRAEGRREGDITIALLPERAWSWTIPFKGDKTSFGVVCNSSVFKGGVDLSQYLLNAIAMSSRLREDMADAERASEVTVISNYSHHCDTYMGERWIAIGDAAVFLDPIFSSGVHVSITSARFAAKVIAQAFAEKTVLNHQGRDQRYQQDLDKGVKRFHSLISLFYQDNFVAQMQKTLTRQNMRQAFTSAVAGDMWNDGNFLFEKSVL